MTRKRKEKGVDKTHLRKRDKLPLPFRSSSPYLGNQPRHDKTVKEGIFHFFSSLHSIHHNQSTFKNVM